MVVVSAVEQTRRIYDSQGQVLACFPPPRNKRGPGPFMTRSSQVGWFSASHFCLTQCIHELVFESQLPEKNVILLFAITYYYYSSLLPTITN